DGQRQARREAGARRRRHDHVRQVPGEVQIAMTRRSSFFLFACAALAAAAVPRVARADIEVHLSSRANDDSKAKEEHTDAPFIDATVIGGSAPPLDKLTLTQTDAKPAAITIKALAVKKYAEGPDKLAVVFLIEGHELWLGNESYVEEGNP